MAPTDQTASNTTSAAGSRERPMEPAGRAGYRHTSRARSALVAISALAIAIALAACGSAPSAHTSALSLSSPARPRATVQVPHARPSGIAAIVNRAKATYNSEAKGVKLFQQLGRIARDGILLQALSQGDLAGAHAEAEAQMRSPVNHTAHVTRISVIRGLRVLFNATVNSDGVFVVAPASRILRLHGRLLGTLLVSIQDVTGFVKLVHIVTHADVVARGATGRVRTSLGAAARVRLPISGQVTIAGRRYFVRSFGEIAWGNEPRGNEPLTVWILKRA